MNYKNSNEELSTAVTAIQRYCLDDGPGVRTTVFLKGCPLRCLWCHNPETHKKNPELMQRAHKCTSCGRCVPVCPTGARGLYLNTDGMSSLLVDRMKCITCGKCAEVCPTQACEICGKEMTVSEVLAEVVRDKIFYKTSGGGMTVSGGECAASPEFTLALIERAVEAGVSPAIETCGYGKAEFYREAAKLGTLFLYDLKEMDKEKHRELTGVTNELILENLEMLMDMGARIIIRMPLIPGVNDSAEELSALADHLAANKGRYEYAQIMPYHSLGNGKALSLGRDPFEVDSELSANGCAACKERWISAFAEKGIEVTCE